MSNIKQAPFLGLTGMGGGGTGLAFGGAVAKQTYLDDIFSTFLYRGNQTAGHTITNGIDLAGKGGLVWIKSRTSESMHELVDTVRGAGYLLKSDGSGAQGGSTSSELEQFNSNGFDLAYRSAGGNVLNMDYASWSFRKQKSFFTIKEYSGSNSTQALSHDLGCIPGLIIIKRTDSSGDWMVYHRSRGAGEYAKLNSNVAFGSGSPWNSTSPTSTTFTVEGNNGFVNTSGGTFIAYLFAGGESTAATARSVDFDGSGDYLSIPSSADLTFGTGDFSIEFWAKPDDFGSRGTLYDGRGSSNTDGITIGHESSSGELRVYMNATSGSDIVVQSSDFEKGQWQHVALTRSSGTVRLFINGTLKDSATRTSDLAHQHGKNIGYKRYDSSSYDYFDGKISNFRIVKGTAVYTSSFIPPYEPLTNITNTKLLCCNNSSTTGSTVTPGTITANGDPTASTDSPFDDPAGFKFGEEEDQNAIKCASYKGSGSAGLEVNVGWQPSWLMIKVTSRTGDWYIMDSMRGVVTSGNDEYLKANGGDVEGSADVIEFTPTGFKVISTGTHWNNSAETYSFTAIRRSDGYVAKPPEAATDIFAIDTGDGNSTIPNFDSGFPVDFALQRPTTAGYTGVYARLMGHNVLYAATTGAQQAESDGQSEFDSNLGWGASSSFQTSSTQSYMWKRSAGFDVVTYVGNSTGDYSGMSQVISHNLNSVPEMIWVKRRDASGYWGVYHKGLNGGTNPENYRMLLNDTHAESAASGSYTNWYWNNTAPTATHFSVGEVPNANAQNSQIIGILFASVSGISHVGSYSGSGSTGNAQNIGFQPRYLLIKRRNSTSDWMQFNSLGGFDKYTQLNTNQQQYSQTYVNVSATGFSLVSDYGDTNESGSTYIYYAHA